MKWAKIDKLHFLRLRKLIEIAGTFVLIEKYPENRDLIVVYEEDKPIHERISFWEDTFDLGMRLKKEDEIEDLSFFYNLLLNEISIKEIAMWIVEKEVQHEYKL